MDLTYDREDILMHINGFLFENAHKTLSSMVGCPHAFVDGTHEELNEETVFTKFVIDRCISAQKVALDSMTDGMHLINKSGEDIINLQEFF